MKVLHVLGSPNIGGIEKLALDFINGCYGKGDISNNVLFTLGSEGPMLEKFLASGAEIYLGKLNSGYDFRPAKLLKIADTFSSHDILHIHTFNPFIAWLAGRSGKKIIYTEHGNFGFGRRRKYADSLKEKMLKYFLHARVDYCIYNSQFTNRIADEKYGRLEGKGAVIHNGITIIDPDVVQNVSRYGTIDFEGKFIVGTISRFAGFKRIDRLIRSFSKFQEGKSDVLLLLVGDGPLAQDLHRLTRDLGILDKVIFTGYQNNPLSWQKEMDVCVFPSKNEPFGLVAIEAMSMGKPVIVFKDGGGLVETVGGFDEDGVVEDEESAACRLQFYYDNQKKDCDNRFDRTEWAKQYSIENMIEKTLSIYKVI